MTDGVNIDWNLLGPPKDYVGDYTNAFQVGRQLAGQRIQQNALTAYGANPSAPVDPQLMAANPELAVQLQNRQQAATNQQLTVQQAQAEAGGDYQGAMATAAGRGATGDVMDLQAKIAGLPAQQQAAALQRAEQIGAVLNGIQGATQDPAQRLAMAQHAAQHFGIDPSQITPDMLTDQAMAQHAAQLAAMERAGMTPEQRDAHDKPLMFGKDQHVIVPQGSRYAPQGASAAGSATGGATTPTTPTSAPVAPAGAVARLITAAAQKYGVDPQLALSIGHAESGLNANTPDSSAGAIGPMQLMPGTARQMGVDPRDVAQNIDGGVRYLAQLSAKYHGDPHLIAAAYNAGPGAVDKHGGVPPFPETQAYVQKVTGSAPGSYQVASLGATPPPPPFNAPSGFVDLNPGAGGADDAATHGHVSTPTELKAAGLPPTTQAWTNSKGEVGDLPKGIADQAAQPAAVDPNAPTGIRFLNTLPASERALVLAYSQGRAPIPTGAALRNPAIAKAFADTAQYDPTFDAASYPARAKARAAFTSGAPAANITSANTVIDHLDTLDKAIDALNNGQIKPFNAIGNAFAANTGNTAITNFNTAKQAVATELARTFQGGAPHETEIQGWLQKLDAAQSPQQLHAVVQGIAGLVANRVNELGDQYNQGMGRTQEGLTLLHPSAAASLARLGGQDGVQAASKASFYQHAEARGMSPPEIDAAWAKFAPHVQASGAGHPANDDAALLAKYGVH